MTSKMTIPDEAVQAAVEAVDEGVNWVAGLFGEKYDNADEVMKVALTAALPFLQGVKVEPVAWSIIFSDHYGVNCETTFKTRQAAENYVSSCGSGKVVPLYLSPSPRAQTLEEAAKLCDLSADSSQDQLNKEQYPVVRDALRGEVVAARVLANRIRALSSQPVADGWLPIETAPKDGKHCILCIKDGAFYYSVQGAFQDGQWNCAYRDNVQPLCWMPNVKIPDHFLPASPGASDTHPTGGSDEH